MVKKLMYIFTFLVWTGIISSCQDEVIVQGSDYIPEGEATINATVNFKPFGSALNGDSRTAGDAIKDIEKLYIVLFDEKGNHLETFDASGQIDYEYVESESRKDVEAGDGEHIAENATPCVTFKKALSYGKYKIYAVANHELDLTKKYTIEELRNINLTWDSDDVKKNNQMFGYFTSEKSNSKPNGWEAPVITIASPTVSLHAWIRRAASKVTVAYDGSRLNDNVNIYIHSVQIKDIPMHCLLGNKNEPSVDDLMADGEKIEYRTTTSSENTGGLHIKKDTPTGGKDNSSEEGGEHYEAANSLFFYENMAGIHADKSKLQDSDNDGLVDVEDDKDGVLNGTYIEVVGYYVNCSASNPSFGNIKYRFMLGKNITDDYNAERNYHYKLTLMFNKDANNPDWHIEYVPENPTILVPNPLYISYVHGEKLNIPVVVTGGTVESFTAEITDNNWHYTGHTMYDESVNGGNHNGFLTFKSEISNSDITDRKSDFDNNSKRNYTVSPNDAGEYHYTVPVYTREVKLGSGYSGNNSYTHKTRSATVTFTVKLKEQTQSLTQNVEIIQVKRAVNPTGVWRKHSSDKSFHIVLMESDAGNLKYSDAGELPNSDFEDDTDFRETVSAGAWNASIVNGRDWVRISQDGTSWSTESIRGKTGSFIDFHYKPDGTIASDETRCGVIKITYHNNTCVHYVFVNQGDAPVVMGTSGTKWHTKNVEYKGKEVDTPLHEGSLFRFHNSNYAIIAENNYRPGFGPFYPLGRYNDADYYSGKYGGNASLWVKDADGQYDSYYWPIADDNEPNSSYFGSRESEYTLGINKDTPQYSASNNSTKGKEFDNIMGSNAKVATVDQWNELQNMPRYYGVLYGDGSVETKKKLSDAYQFPFTGGAHTDYSAITYDYDKGMRGVFVWDKNNGNHIFLPIGATGYGHRSHFPDWGSEKGPYSGQSGYIDTGALKYATKSEPWGNKNVPLLNELYLAWGAIYWCSQWNSSNGDDDQADNDTSNDGGQNAMDINYHTYDFNSYSEHATWRRVGGGSINSITQSSDACLIRCVEK